MLPLPYNVGPLLGDLGVVLPGRGRQTRNLVLKALQPGGLLGNLPAQPVGGILQCRDGLSGIAELG